MRFFTIVAVLLITTLPVHAQRMSYGKALAEPAREPDLSAIGIDQRLGEQVDLGLIFRNEHGDEVTLGSCVGGKPTVLVLAFYRCQQSCPVVLYNLVDTLRKIPGNVGEDYNVVVVSFDPKDNYPIAFEWKQRWTKMYARNGAEEGMHFLTGDKGSIDALCAAVGFRYEYDREKKQYNHAAGVMVLTPFGKLSRYFYGISSPGMATYDDQELQAAIKEASQGMIGKAVEPSEMLKFLCYEFNPVNGGYTLSVLKGLRLLFTLMVVGMAIWLIRAWRKPSPTVPTNAVSLPHEN